MGGKKAKTTTTQRESPLAKQQGRILGQREQIFREQQLPLLLDLISQTGGEGLTNLFAQRNVADINQLFQGAQTQLSQSLARRGLRGSGVEIPALAQLGAARSSALAQALNQARLQQFQSRTQVASLLGQFTPRPTTAVPSPLETRTTTERGGSGAAIGAGLGALAGFAFPPLGALAGLSRGAAFGTRAASAAKGLRGGAQLGSFF